MIQSFDIAAIVSYDSEQILNRTLKGLEQRSIDLKLTINPSKTNLSVFSTDSKHRYIFHPNITIFNTRIEKVSKPKYLDLVFDNELNFNQQILECSSKALKKVTTLRRLCSTKWGVALKTLKATYTTFIRPIMEYAISIWLHSCSSLEKLNNV